MRTLEEEKHRLPKRHRFSNDRHKFGFALLLRVFRHGLRKPSSFYLIKR